MTDLRKAAEMALDALEGIHVGNMTPMAEENWNKALTALRQALAQPEPILTEKDGSPCPEFWDWLPKAYNFEGLGEFTKYNMEVAFLAGKNTALAQPEPQVCCGDYEKCMKPCTPRGRWLANQQMTRLKQEKGQFVGGVPSVSQQREWVGLTNEEIADGQAEGEARSFRSAVRWVEAKLKEKNT